MLKFETPVILQLPPGQLMRWMAPDSTSVRVLQGRVWVTQVDDFDDHFLGAGQSMLLHPDAAALISAEGSAQIVVEASPERAPSGRRGRPGFP